MRVSVVIKVFNQEPYLDAAIQSALAQTHPDVETIVVDDGSTDASREIARRYGERIRRVEKANGGQASAVNAGFAVAAGEVVHFLDGDDVLDPGAMAHAAAALSDSAVSMHWFPMTTVDAQDRPTSEGVVPPYFVANSAEYREIVACAAICPGPPTSGMAFARTFLERVLPIDESVWQGGIDWYLGVLAPFYGHVTSGRSPLAYYRRHDASVTADARGNPWSFAQRLQRRQRYEALIADALRAEGRRPPKRGFLHRPQDWNRRIVAYKIGSPENPYRDTLAGLVRGLLRSALYFHWEPRRTRLKRAVLGFWLLAQTREAILTHFDSLRRGGFLTRWQRRIANLVQGNRPGTR